jgi:hypothetical protein
MCDYQGLLHRIKPGSDPVCLSGTLHKQVFTSCLGRALWYSMGLQTRTWLGNADMLACQYVLVGPRSVGLHVGNRWADRTR